MPIDYARPPHGLHGGPPCAACPGCVGPLASLWLCRLVGLLLCGSMGFLLGLVFFLVFNLISSRIEVQHMEKRWGIDIDDYVGAMEIVMDKTVVPVNPF